MSDRRCSTRTGSSPLARGLQPPRNRRLKAGGSSPLARGLPLMPAHGVGASRIIPARAGFTSSSGPCSRTRTDHPRSRGVYVDAHARKADLTGIIPARAGFTGTGSTCPPTGMDHPRSHGVYFDPAPGRHSVPGSSPLARGLRSLLLSSRSGPRIIPARAGFTSRRRCDRQREGDHPRSRGVYVRRSPWSSGAGGSSPLARGLLDHVVQEQDGPGIIPARAGFTLKITASGR